MPSITTSYGTVSYTDEGDRSCPPEPLPGSLRSCPPILLLHATLHDHSDYAPVLPALTRGRRVLALDWPGHGQSPVPAEPLTAAELGSLAVEFVDALDLQNLVVIGNSVGGYAACRIAVERPDRVAGLVLVNTGGFTPHSPFSRAFCSVMGRPSVIRRVSPLFARAYMRPKTESDREIVARVAARADTADGARTAAALWRSFGDPMHDLRQSASGIAAPTLITWGARDVTAPLRWGRLVARAVPGARLTPYPTGHVVFSSEPDAWLREVSPFITAAHASSRHGQRHAPRG